MPSSLYGLARSISEYVRKRYGQQTRNADKAIDRQQPSDYVRGRKSLHDQMREVLFGREKKQGKESKLPGNAPPGSFDQRDGAAPAVDLRKTWPGSPDAEPPEAEYDDIQILGRDAGYDQGDFDAVMDGMRNTEGSSNVYGYYFERESRRTGIMYVTFLGRLPDGQRGGAGPTYAYYDVSVRKAVEFTKSTATSAGEAVWDYLRIRGTSHGHQHQYRLISSGGEYVPRKTTPWGYRNRAVPAIGPGRRSFQRNTLPEQAFSRGTPDRGRPDRGRPSRGQPDRG